MYYLENAQLKVSILDPGSTTDQKRVGPRFCTGNYIWQVEKKGYGPLLSGPQYPDPKPPVADGQGLPEVFQAVNLDKEIRNGDPVLIIGVGQVAYHHNIQIMRKKQRLLQSCDWEVEAADHCISMITRQESGRKSLRLMRKADLKKNVLTIKTTLQNTGNHLFSFRWFAHPFFPVKDDSQPCCRLLFSTKMANNPGFMLSKDQHISIKEDHNWTEGHFQLLEGSRGEWFKACIYHPESSNIKITGDFPLKKVALWANDNTFSIEPFYEQQVAPAGEVSWELTYAF